MRISVPSNRTDSTEVHVNIEVQWSQPIAMKRLRSVGYSIDLVKVPESSGVYVFGRRWGDSFEALYVGKALDIRARMNQQLNNLRLMSHVRDAKVGNRVLVAGVINTKGGQKIEKCLALVEKALIRHFLSEGDDLVNVQGTLLRRHTINFVQAPRWLAPKEMYLDSNTGD
jgi:hypothetical protein